MSDVDDADAVVEVAPPPKKIGISEMVDYCRDYIGDLERFSEYAKERPETCDHRPAERKAQAFRQMLSTLELVQVHEKAFINLIRGAQQTRRRS